ncbi:MAG: hypothetical protein EOM26_03965 [Alphaproteobacteria bacterium]|nr:hypothetical protein [Alphaproteobacteria bacterium]
MMRSPTLRVALIENEFPPDIMTPEMKTWLDANFTVGAPDRFPDGARKAIEKGIGFWYEGNIEFVNHDEKPDLAIIAHNDEYGGGFASFPAHDHTDPEYDYVSPGVQVIGVAVPGLKNFDGSGTRDPVDSLERLVRHEFGHSLGIIHPQEAVEMLVNQNMGCTASDLGAQQNSDWERGVMSPYANGDPTQQDFDIKIRLQSLIKGPGQ